MKRKKALPVEELYRLAGIYNNLYRYYPAFYSFGAEIAGGHLGSELQRKAAAIPDRERY